MHEKIKTLNIKRTSKSGQFDLAIYEKNWNIKGRGKVRQFDSKTNLGSST